MNQAGRSRWLVRASVFAALLQPFDGSADPRKAPVVSVDKWSRQVACKVDSEPYTDLLRCFNVARARKDAHVPVTVVLAPTVPLHAIWDLQLVAGKAQVDDLRFLASFGESKTVWEVRLVPTASSGVPAP